MKREGENQSPQSPQRRLKGSAGLSDLRSPVPLLPQDAEAVPAAAVGMAVLSEAPLEHRSDLRASGMCRSLLKALLGKTDL